MLPSNYNYEDDPDQYPEDRAAVSLNELSDRQGRVEEGPMQPVKAEEKTVNLLTKVVSQAKTKWDILLAPKRRLEGHLSKVQAFDWGGDDYLTQLVSVDDLGTVIHWDAAKGSKITLFELNVTSHCIAMEPVNGSCAAVGTTNGEIVMLELNNIGKFSKGINAKPQARVAAHTSPLFAIKFLDGEHLITGGGDNSVCIWDVQSMSSCISRHTKHKGEVYALSAFEDDPNIFVSASTDGCCMLWDIRVPQPVQGTFEGHTAAVNTVEFMPGKMTCFASGADDATIRLWDLRMESEVSVFCDSRFPGDGVNAISFSNSGRVIFAGTDNRYLKSWDVLTDGPPFEYFDYGYQCPITQAHLSTDGYTLGVVGQDGVLGIAC